MNRAEIINKLKKNFDIRELVSKDVFNKFGENAWKLFDIRLLELLYALRYGILRKPMIINNWSSGGNYTQRGYRENICDIVKQKTLQNKLYVSAHMLGMAFDFHCPGISADEVRHIIALNARELPYAIRLENSTSAPTWVHVDVMVNMNTTAKVSLF